MKKVSEMQNCFSKNKLLDRLIKNKRSYHFGSYRIIQTIRDYITNNFISINIKIDKMDKFHGRLKTYTKET